MEIAPLTGRSEPSSASSPAIRYSPTVSLASCRLASSSPKAIGRSKAGPSLRRSAGARLITTRVCGKS